MHSNALMYRVYLKSPDTETWDRLPLALRVRLTLRCGWLDALYEVSVPLGRLADRLWKR